MQGTTRRFSTIFALMMIILPLSHAPLQARTSVEDQRKGLMTMAPVLSKVTPAVVNIAVESHQPARDNPLMMDPFFRRFFDFDMPQPGPQRQRRTMAAGSGVIIDADKGYVLTNHHVAKNADTIRVTLKDGRTFRAKLIGSDPGTDVALLQINAKNLTAVPAGDSDSVRVGDFVMAIGNPFGLGQTVTSGIVSALGRSMVGAEKYEDFIQTDASINPGNSGGALVNSKGELIGINTAIIAPGGGNVGIGFAVPVNMVRAIMNQLLEFGEVRRGRIGVVIQTLTPDMAAVLGLGAQRGAVISRVEKGAPAEKAGLKAGDVITAINGRPVKDSNDVRNRIGLMVRGTRVRLSIIRNGQKQMIAVKIGKSVAGSLAAGNIIPQLEGATLAPVSSDDPAHGQVAGVLVESIETGSPAARTGLRAGDIITALNRRPVSSIEELKQAAAASRNGAIALNIWRNGSELFIFAR